MSESQEGVVKFNRRKFLKLAGGAAAATVAAAAISQSSKLGEFFRLFPEQKTAEQKLVEEGAEDFLPFYNAMLELQHYYYSVPRFTSIRFSFDFDLMDVLNSLSRGHKGPNGILTERLLKGWGEQKSQATELAHQKVTGMKIEVQPGVKDDPEQARLALARFADVLPAHVMAIPDTVRILTGGGYIDIQKAKVIAIESPAQNLEGFYRSGLHELSHAESEWYILKSYVDRAKYLEYLTTEVQAIKQIMDAYFSTPWTDRQKIKGGQGLVPGFACADTGTIAKWEASFNTQYGLDASDQAPLSEKEMEDRELRYNRLLWVVGRHRRAIRDKELADETLDDKEKKFLIDWNVHSLLNSAVADLHHYFVGPVQRKDGGLASPDLPLDNPDTLITDLNKQVQLARLRATSTLSDQELATFESSAEALRQKFGVN